MYGAGGGGGSSVGGRESWASGAPVGVALGDPSSDTETDRPSSSTFRKGNRDSLGPPIQSDLRRNGSGSGSGRSSPARHNGDGDGQGQGQGYRLSQLPPRADVEELEDEAHTPATQHSWDGPMAALSKRMSGMSSASSLGESPAGPVRRLREEGQGLGIGLERDKRHSYGNSYTPEVLDGPSSSSDPNFGTGSGSGSGSVSAPASVRKPLPTVTVTPDMTPTRARQQQASVSGDDSRRVSMLSSSTSDSPSLSRLTPRLSGGYGNGNRSMSQASFGSSQYPGEDPEAFRIRSTCKYRPWDSADDRCETRVGRRTWGRIPTRGRADAGRAECR